jgi:DNA-binding transcriptional regulator YiaG
MISPREHAPQHAQNSVRLAERIRAFMQTYGLSRAQMAEVISTPPRTLDRWLDDGVTPPACLLALMDLLETRPQVRSWIGVNGYMAAAPRGRPFKRGNEYRFNDRRREEALARARAI